MIEGDVQFGVYVVCKVVQFVWMVQGQLGDVVGDFKFDVFEIYGLFLDVVVVLNYVEMVGDES